MISKFIFVLKFYIAVWTFQFCNFFVSSQMLFENNVFDAGVEDPNSGSFRFSVRLEDIFGFATDYNRVMYGFVHTLTLVRNVNHNDVLFGKTGAAAGKVEFTQISWILPLYTSFLYIHTSHIPCVLLIYC